MSDANLQLTTLIDNLVESKTFSLDALDAVKKLKDRAIELERTLEMKNQQIADLLETKRHSENTIREQRRLIDGIDAREAAVQQRESKIFEVEKACAISTARAQTFEQAMKIVFAPNMVRNAVQGFGGISRADGRYDNTSENRTTTVVDGYARDGDSDVTSGTSAQPKNVL